MIRPGIEKRGSSAFPVWLAAVSVFLALAACGGPEGSAEEQLYAWIETAEAHAEAKERRELIAMLSPGYVDSRGNKSDYVDDVLRFWFFRQHKIELLIAVDEVRVFDDSAAQLDITVGMAGTDNSRFGFSADAYQFVLELEYIDDEWLLLAADWDEVGG